MTTLLVVAMPSLSPFYPPSSPTPKLSFSCGKVFPKIAKSLEKMNRSKKFRELINKEQYEEIAELGEGMSDKELLKCLCQVVTSLDHFKGLYGYLKQRKMVPGFLAHGEMVVVRESDRWNGSS